MKPLIDELDMACRALAKGSIEAKKQGDEREGEYIQADWNVFLTACKRDVVVAIGARKPPPEVHTGDVRDRVNQIVE